MPASTAHTEDEDVVEILLGLVQWHSGQVSQLQRIVDEKDADIVIGDQRIEGDSKLAGGIRTGISIALIFLGKLPITLTPPEGGEDDLVDEG